MTEFVWSLIPNFAEVMAPLYELKEHYLKWCWDVKDEQALQSIKYAVWNSINNTFPDFAGQNILFTVASDVAIAGARSTRWILWMKS